MLIFDMLNAKPLSVATDTTEFFYSILENSSKNQGLLLSPDLLKYLSSVLSYYSLSKNFCQEKNLHKTLSTKYLKAFSANTSSKSLLLKQVAEESLYSLGFFTPFFKKKIIGINYYIHLGSQSYKRLADLKNKEDEKNIFLYCSENFLCFLNLFDYISKNTLKINPIVKI